MASKSETVNKRENIYRLDGFGKVFKFTLQQTFKNKSYLLSFIIFVLVMVLQRPINYFASRAGQDAADGQTKVTAESIENIYIVNETDCTLDEKAMTDSLKAMDEEGDDVSKAAFEKVQFSKSSADDVISGLSQKDCAVVIGADGKSYTVKGVVASGSEVQLSEVDALLGFVESSFEEARLVKAGLDEESLTLLEKGIYIDGVETEMDYSGVKDGAVSGSRYSFFMITFSIIIFLACSMSTSYVIASVTEEKTSKLVESLLVSVRPMALLLGKILGMMCYVLSVLVLGVLGAKLVDFIMFEIMKLENNGNTGGFDINILTSFGIKGLIVFVPAIILGFLTFSIFSGMLGSACSQTEDIQSATGTVMMLSMLGYFGAMACGAMDITAVNNVMSLVPPFSIFAMPVSYLAGRITLPMMLLSFGIQIAVLVFLMWLMARTYRNLLLTDSSKPKLSAIFRAART